MKLLVRKGGVDKTIDIFIADSSSTTGAGLTGLAFNSAGLACYYRRGATGAATALALATQTVGGAHSDGGFVEISSANMPGWYRLDLSDAIIATGVPYVTMMLRGATNMAPLPLELQLVDFDPEDAAALGLSRLDAAITTRSSHSAADVWAVGSRTLTSFGTLVADIWANATRTLTSLSGLVPANFTALSITAAGLVDITQAAADKVWGSAARTLTAFDAAFKTGYSLSAAGVQAIWDALTSALTTVGSIGKLLVDNIDAAISSRLAGASYTAPPSAAANAAATAAQITTDHGSGSYVRNTEPPTTAENRDAVLAGIVEGTVTVKQSLQLSNAAAAAKLSGAATSTTTLRDLADTKDRIVATTDADGNRTAVTRNLD